MPSIRSSIVAQTGWRNLFAALPLLFHSGVSNGPGIEDPSSRADRLSACGQLLVRVIDGITRMPVVGAQLRWVEIPADPLRSAFGVRTVEDLGQQDSVFGGAPVGATTDGDGYAEVPRPGRPWLVRTTAPGLFGSTRLTGASGISVELEVLPDWPVAVEVVDRGGRPAADVPVCLRRERDGLFVNETTVRSDEHGRASLPHVGYRLLADPAERDARWFAGLAILAHEPVHRELDRRSQPSSPVRLVLPATGSIELQIGDALGRTVNTPFPVELRRVLPSGTPAITMPFGDPAHPWDGSALPLEVCYVRPLLDGRVVLPFVELGLEVQASARRNERSAPTIARFRGPLVAGERAKARLEFGGDQPTFTGRLLDASGHPLVGEELVLSLSSDKPSNGGTDERRYSLDLDSPPLQRSASPPTIRVRTDADGRFSVDYAAEDAPALGRRLLILHTIDRGVAGIPSRESEGAAYRSASIPLDELWTVGIHDLGDIRIAVPAGTSPSGPSSSSTITLGTNELLAEGRVVSKTTALGVPDVRISLLYSSERLALGRSGPAGRFQVRGPIVWPLTRLHFGLDPDDRGLTCDVVPGSRGLVIEFEGQAAIDVRVSFPPGLDPSAVRAYLRNTAALSFDPFEEEEWSRELRLDPLGRGSLENLRPGSYSLSVGPLLDGGMKEFAQWSGPLEPGRREVDIDLSSPWQARKLDVMDSSGRSLSGWYFATSFSVAQLLRRGLRAGAVGDEAAASFPGTLAALPGLTVEIASPGFLPKLVTLDTLGTRIVLEPAPSLTLELDRPIGAVPKGWRLVMGTWRRGSGENAGREPRRLGFESSPFDEAGRATWAPPGPGAYWVEWILEETGPKARALRVQDRSEAVIVASFPTTPKTLRVMPRIDPARIDFATLTTR